MVNRFYEALGRVVVKWRWVVVAVWFVAMGVGTGLPQMAQQSQSQSSSFLPASSPSQQAAAMLTPLVGSTKYAQFQGVAVSLTGKFAPEDLAALKAAEASVATVNHVTSVKAVGIAPAGDAAQLVIGTNVPFFNQQLLSQTFSDVKKAMASASLRPGLEIYPAGQTADSLEGGSKTKSQNTTIELFSLLFILALLFLIFRSLLAPILIVVPAVFASGISSGIIGLLGEHGLKISAIAVFLLTVLILGAGVDYGLFLVFRVREEIENGRDHRGAVVEAVHKVGESITASAGTVIVALLTVLSATFGIYHDLAIPLAIGITVMLLAGLTLQPALVAIFGKATFWPMKVKARDHVDGWWGRTAGRLLAKPLLTLTVGVVALGALAAFVPQDRPAGFGGETAAPAGSPTAKGDAVIAKAFPKTSDTATAVVMAFSTSLWDDPAKVADVEQRLLKTGDFTKVTSPFDQLGNAVPASQIVALKEACGPAHTLPAFQGALPATAPELCRTAPPVAYQAYVATARTMSADGKTVVFQTAMSAGAGASTEALNAVPTVREHLSTVGSAISAKEVGFYGFAAILADVSSLSSKDLRLMVPLAALAIGLILALVLRSLIAPLYLIASVVLSYLASLGFAVIVFMKIGGATGLIYFLPFMLFLFLLALGEDYNILVMTRIREEARKQPLKQAVITAIGTTGTTVTSAGLVLAGTFVVFGIVIGASGGSGSSAFNAVAYGLAAGILMDTFIVRTVLVPTLVVLLGRWNWWPSKLTQVEVNEVSELQQ